MGICMHKTPPVICALAASPKGNLGECEEAKVSGPVVRKKYVRTHKRCLQTSEGTEPCDYETGVRQQVTDNCCGLVVGGPGQAKMWMAKEADFCLVGIFLEAEKAASKLPRVLREQLAARSNPQAALMAAFEAGKDEIAEFTEKSAICMVVLGKDAIWAGSQGDCTLLLSPRVDEGKPYAEQLILRDEPHSSETEVSKDPVGISREPSFVQHSVAAGTAVLVGSAVVRERVSLPEAAQAMMDGQPQVAVETVARLTRREEGCCTSLALVVAYLPKT